MDDAVFVLAGHNKFGLNSDQVELFDQIKEKAVVDKQLVDIGGVIREHQRVGAVMG